MNIDSTTVLTLLRFKKISEKFFRRFVAVFLWLFFFNFYLFILAIITYLPNNF